MFVLFTIAGIFIAVCWHGHLLVICNMVPSGELLSELNFLLFGYELIQYQNSDRMKYPLAVIN